MIFQGIASFFKKDKIYLQNLKKASFCKKIIHENSRHACIFGF